MSRTNYERNRVLDVRYGGSASYTKPGTVYIALFTSMPTVLGNDGTEVSGGSYARVAVTNNATNFPNASAGAKSNANDITFPGATASWGSIVGVGIYDAATVGNLQDFQTLVTPKTVGNGDVFSLSAGQLTLQSA
jgi:hypothetical protein